MNVLDAKIGLVLLTRRDEDNREVGRHLDELSVPWQSLPCIALETVRPDDVSIDAVQDALPLSAVAFTSRWSVTGLLALPRLIDRWQLKREPCITAAVGPSTAAALQACGFDVNLTAEPPTAAALGRALVARLTERHAPGHTVLFPRGDRPRPELPGILTGAGFRVVPLQVYRHIPVEPDPTNLSFPLDWVRVVVCASPSAADTLLNALPVLADRAFVAMGPTTAGHLRDKGVKNVSRPARTDPRALAEAAARLL